MLLTTYSEGEAWPSVMMEVGYSEGIDFLRLDAEWWLVHSQGQTRFVIIGKFERDPFALCFECWMMVESGRRETRGHLTGSLDVSKISILMKPE